MIRRDLVAALAPQIEPHVERDLVVAAAAGVQLGAAVTGDLGDAPFDRGVDVFVGRRERERTVGELLLDPIERGRDDAALLLAQQSDAREHLHVRTRTGEVVGREPPVERQADGEREQLVGRAFAEPAVPERLSVLAACHSCGSRHVGARALAARPRLGRQAPQPHEAFGVLVAERVFGVVGREVVVVEPTSHAATDRIAATRFEPQPHLAGHVLLRRRPRTRRARA